SPRPRAARLALASRGPRQGRLRSPPPRTHQERPMTEGDNAMDKAMEKGHSMSLMTEGLTTPARWQCKDCQAQALHPAGRTGLRLGAHEGVRVNDYREIKTKLIPKASQAL